MSIVPASSVVCARQFGPGRTLGACVPLAGEPFRSSAEANALQPRTAPHDLRTCLHMSCACSSALLHTRSSPRVPCTPARRRTSRRRAALAAASAPLNLPEPSCYHGWITRSTFIIPGQTLVVLGPGTPARPNFGGLWCCAAAGNRLPASPSATGVRESRGPSDLKWTNEIRMAYRSDLLCQIAIQRPRSKRTPSTWRFF